jgi:hypothetical protein
MASRIQEIVRDIIESLETENTRRIAEYNRNVTFNRNQQALIDDGQIEGYDITEVERPKVVRIVNQNAIMNAFTEFLRGLERAHIQDPGIEGLVVEDYRTPQEIKESGKTRHEARAAAGVSANQAAQSNPTHRPVAGDKPDPDEELNVTNNITTGRSNDAPLSRQSDDDADDKPRKGKR